MMLHIDSQSSLKMSGAGRAIDVAHPRHCRIAACELKSARNGADTREKKSNKKKQIK